MRLGRSAFQTRKPPRAGRPAWKCAEEYKRWLRKLPCACCGGLGDRPDPIVAAHVDHAGGKGMASKAADRHCIPLLDSCHKRQHAVGWATFERVLPGRDAVTLAAEYWGQFPGRIQWERDLAANPDGMRGAPRNAL